ncbi:MAG: asparagine synthase (glutamine-hydrolyzing) [Deltaproteobacteria bacterium]|nr:asparagine synthase (glutamine-hydrolyzing) [Deltaproteobacteria bacterium]
MCGIVGVHGFAATARDERAHLQRMRDTMVHRGPDDAGIWQAADRSVALAHRRLSIVDLSAAGRQPISNEDGSVWLTFNGEIYNHAGLREPLIAAGHTFRSRCDAEAIVHGYEEHGPAVVDALDGMFAFGLWDAGARRLLLARDRLGKKPLYYVEVGGRLLFASEIKALLAHPDVGRDLDPVALDLYLTFGNVPAPRTLFAGIRKLPPAHVLTCTRERGIEVRRYWSPLDAETFGRPVPDDEAADHTLTLLRRAVHKRMMSDVPVGALLSGGIDSSANVALMTELLGRPLRTFSVGFTGFGPGENFHDLPYARRVAAAFGCEHHEIAISAEECRAHVPELATQLDEPIGDPACLPMHFAARAARAGGVTVVLVGEGSDEVFGGYDALVHLLDTTVPRFESVRRLPRIVRRGLHGLARLLGAPAGRIDVLRRAARDEPLYWGLDVAFWDTEKAALLAHDRPSGGAADVVRGFYRELAARRPSADRLQQVSWVELCNRLPELLLMRVDKLTMAHSLEARAPFLDADLVSYALGLPSAHKIRGRITKYVLRRAVRGVVPRAVLERPKQGFRVPLPEWLRGELSGWARHQLRDAAIHRRGLFRRAELDRMWEQHVAGAYDHSFDLWCLLNLFAWYERWIEGSP